MRHLPLVTAVVFLLLSFASGLQAHPISMSAAAVNAQPDEILVNLKIMLEDLVMYHGLQSGANERFSHADLTRAAEQHRAFILKYFAIRDARGELLNGEIRRLDLSQIPPEGAPQAVLMARNVFYHVAFPLSQPQEFITFTQTFGGKDAVLPAVMELIVFQNRILLQRSAQLQQNRPHTVRFDWDNPPTAAAQNRRPDILQQRDAFEKQLGITSYTGLYSFLYITTQEVRHELLMPLATLEQWLPLKRAQTDFIEVSEQQAARNHIEAFFQQHATLSINGQITHPVMARLQFFGLDIQDFAQNATPRRVSAHQTRIGVILSYATTSAPRQVDMTWELFNAYAPFLRSVVYAYDQEPSMHDFKKGASDWHWTHPGDITPPALSRLPTPELPARWPLPVISLMSLGVAIGWLPIAWRRRRGSLARSIASIAACLVISGLCWPIARLETPSPFTPAMTLSTAEASELTSALLRHLYRAFDFRAESDIYDALAQSVDGELLQTLYLQIQQSLKIQEQGGAIARVQDVRLVDAEVIDSGGGPQGMPQFDIKSRWRVTGTVEHWGHRHTRENEYEAILAVSAQPEGWKITAYTLLDEQRVRFQTGLRRAAMR